MKEITQAGTNYLMGEPRSSYLVAIHLLPPRTLEEPTKAAPQQLARRTYWSLQTLQTPVSDLLRPRVVHGPRPPLSIHRSLPRALYCRVPGGGGHDLDFQYAIHYHAELFVQLLT